MNEEYFVLMGLIRNFRWEEIVLTILTQNNTQADIINLNSKFWEWGGHCHLVL